MPLISADRGRRRNCCALQEFYTSPQSNIKDALGQDALVSLVGTIGTGLTWSGSIFVNPMIARTKNIKLITLSGVVIMSLGLILASYSTRVSMRCVAIFFRRMNDMGSCI